MADIFTRAISIPRADNHRQRSRDLVPERNLRRPDGDLGPTDRR
jgi:hypothetical protein